MRVMVDQAYVFVDVDLITVVSVRDEDELYPTAICTIRILAVPCMKGLLQFFSHSHLRFFTIYTQA